MATHTLDATPGVLHGVFDRRLPPALTVRPGDRVRVLHLPDATWNLCHQPRPLQPPDLLRTPPPGPEHDGHCMVGPIAVEGAKAGMTLEVVTRRLRTADWGWTCAGGFPCRVNRRLGLEERPTCWIAWEIEDGLAREPGGIGVPVRPFLGLIGLPPSTPGLHSSVPPRFCGGNLDCRELVEGSSLFLPIATDGALLSFGDGHAAQGDGEVAGVAIECPMEEVEIELRLHPDLKLEEPRAITPAGRLTLAVDVDVNRAWERALAAMVGWMQELFDLEAQRALALATVAVDLRITQVANGVCGVHALLQEDRLRRV